MRAVNGGVAVAVWCLPAFCLTLTGCGESGSSGGVKAEPASHRVETRQPLVVPPMSAADLAKWGEHTQDFPFVLGYDRGLELAREQNRPAMMFFTTTWCGYCKKLAEVNFHDPEVKQALGDFVCVIVDGDAEESAKTQLGATQGYPHIVFVSPQGEKLTECLGYKPPADFLPIVRTAMSQLDSQ